MKFHSDEDLWYAFQVGNREALDQLFRSYYPSLYRYGLKICRNIHQTEESIQDFFLYLFEHRSHLGKPSSTKAYLLGSYRRRLLRQLQAERSRTRIHSQAAAEQVDIEFSIDEVLISDEKKQHVNHLILTTLNELPKRQREVLYLRYYQELSINDISEILDISYQGVVNTMYKGMKSLRGSEALKKILIFISIITPYIIS
ncbi:MAG: sigma-70 family RNA polymerase sigma factor [Saprospiraceae bacterium]|nr:sigma-70 family RNA polymerase sigma factor [Saprospiraceae bacterium]